MSPMRNAFYRNGKLICETIEAERLLRFFTQNKFGRLFYFLAKTHWVSKLYGFFMSISWSRYKINPFIKKYAIDMNDFVTPSGGFVSFNDFFIRKLQPGARPVDRDSSALVSPADSKLFVVPRVTGDTRFFIKSKKFCLKTFLGDDRLAKAYENGTLLLFRLAPCDYHRYHFPCDCVPSHPKIVSGALESVHPIVYAAGSLPLQTNERHVIRLETEKFGSIMMVAVGAQLVGSITHTYAPDQQYRKGDQAGYFSFGGSSLVLLFKKDVLAIDQEFITHSQENYETEVKMGEKL